MQVCCTALGQTKTQITVIMSQECSTAEVNTGRLPNGIPGLFHAAPHEI